MNRREFVAAASAAMAASTAAEAQAPATTVGEERLHGRRAFVVQNNRMRLAVLPGGGFIGDVSLKSADPATSINPMRVAHYQTIDPYTYDMKRDGARFGTGMQRRLMSGYMGHFTCFPHFAASSQAELAQDYGQHGELIAVEWKRGRGESGELVMNAHLPMTQYAFERRVLLPPGETVAYVTETAENLVKYDRPYTWTQHTTFGPPFVEIGKTFADGSVANVIIGRGPTATRTTFPTGTGGDGAPRDFRPFVGQGSLWLLQQNGRAYCTLYNENYNTLIGYVFDGARNPWLLDYQENQRVTEVPWDGKVIMRGLCWGNSTMGLRAAVQTQNFMGAPTFAWIEARKSVTESYAIFLAEVGKGFRGVGALAAANGQITLTERETGRTIIVPASRLT